MSFYSQLASTGTRLLAKYGRDVVLRKVTQSGSYNPATGSQANTTSDTTYKGVVLDYKDGETEVQGELVLKGDKQLLLEPAAAPTAQDAILIGGVLFQVLSVKEVNPAGTRVLRVLHLRH